MGWREICFYPGQYPSVLGIVLFLIFAMTYSQLTTAIIQQAQAREDALPLKNEFCRSRFFFHPQPTDKVMLFFHGFTGVPYQFESIGQLFFDSGYNVLIPLLPGHGRAGNWDRHHPTPLPIEPQAYYDFGLAWLQQAQALGAEVCVGGLSGGGTLALWMAQQRPQAIAKAIAFSPYLTGKYILSNLFIALSDSYYQWPGDPNQKKGYSNFRVPALRVFLDMGKVVIERARRPASAPIFIFSTEADTAVDTEVHHEVILDTLQHQPKSGYYRFPLSLDVPHSMMTIGEGNEWENVLNHMAKAYVESDLTWAEVEEIAYRMTEGKPFNTVVAELNLEQRVAPDLPTLINMIDKRSLVMARNPTADLG
jgi:esterase/lipase